MPVRQLIYAACAKAQAGRSFKIYGPSIDKYIISYYYAQITAKDKAVGPKYEIGHKVIIRPVSDQPSSQREGDIDTYSGQTGEIADYYWISPRAGNTFYIYTVRAGADNKELVLHEDELEPYIA